MMFHTPFPYMPYYNRYTRYGYSYPYYSHGNTESKVNISQNNNVHNVHENREKKEVHSSDNSDNPLFHIFGLNLYFDDILLICLIWFLYDEGVKDESLFIALILLLLS